MQTNTVLPSEFEIHGSRYVRGEDGVIEQLNPGACTYDANYIRARYETYPREQLVACAHLRLGLVSTLAKPYYLHRLLDYGYGNGAFLSAAVNHPQISAHGYEINGWPIPAGATSVYDPLEMQWDTVCFFDVMEHIPNLRDVLARLNTRNLVISLPWCHANMLGADWFANWKHRRPGEHIWHFDADSITAFLARFGYGLVHFIGNPEDAVRRPSGHAPANILTVIASKF